MTVVRGWRLRLIAAALVTAGVALFSSCGGDAGGGWSAQDTTLDMDAPVQPIAVNSQLGTGENRLVFALFDHDRQLVADASVTARLYLLEGEDGNEGVLVESHELTPVTLPDAFAHLHADGDEHLHEGSGSTVYVATASFSRAGWWGVELDVVAGELRAEGLRLRLWVSEHTTEPALGAPAPRSVQRVLRDVDGISEIDTSNPPLPEMHRLTIAEAIEGGRPVVIAFATPAFCQTRFCGPVIDSIMRPLHRQYAGRAEFVHIEPYDLAEARQGRLIPVPQMAEWGLSTEPWVFVVDATGTVRAKFEGITSLEEVSGALEPLLAAGAGGATAVLGN